MSEPTIVYDDEVCEARGPALKHVIGHATGRCNFCVQVCRPAAFRPQAPGPLPPIDVAARLQALGLINSEGVPVEREPCDDDTVNLHEAKWITGNGPEGNHWSRNRGRSRDGSGSLSDEDKRRLEFFCEKVRDSQAEP